MVTPEQDARRRKRVLRQQVLDLRHTGKTFDDIGAILGISQSKANAIYNGVIQTTADPTLADHRALMMAQLRAAIEPVMGIVLGHHVMVATNGTIVCPRWKDPDGEWVYGDPLDDPKPVLDAARTLVMLQDRWSKLVGADAPTRTQAEVTIVDTTNLAVRRLIDQQALANKAIEARHGVVDAELVNVVDAEDIEDVSTVDTQDVAAAHPLVAQVGHRDPITHARARRATVEELRRVYTPKEGDPAPTPLWEAEFDWRGIGEHPNVAGTTPRAPRPIKKA